MYAYICYRFIVPVQSTAWKDSLQDNLGYVSSETSWHGSRLDYDSTSCALARHMQRSELITVSTELIGSKCIWCSGKWECYVCAKTLV